LPGKVFTHGNAQYEEFFASFWAATTKDVRPRSVVVPSDTSDVSKAVQVLRLALERGLNVKLAIRSGTHVADSSISNVHDGVVIWLRDLTALDLSSDKTVVAAGPGNTVGEILQKLEPEGLAAVLSNHAAVGIGGLIVHGMLQKPVRGNTALT
jgi:FAD/FMN-containing dehydrogenase